MPKKFACAFILLCFARISFATSLDSETSVGDSSFGQDLLLSNRAETSEWSLGYSYGQISSDPIEKTNAFTASAGWIPQLGTAMGGGIEYSNTPSTNLKSTGMNFYFNTRYRFGTEEDSFRPALRFRLRGGLTNYTSSLGSASSTRRRGTPTTTSSKADLGIRQTSVTFALGASPWSWGSFRVGRVYYFYDANVAEFSDSIGASPLLSSQAGGFAESLTSFKKLSDSLDIIIDPYESWSLTMSWTRGVSATDESLSRTAGLSVDYEWNEVWTTGMGYERSIDSSTNGYKFTINYTF